MAGQAMVLERNSATRLALTYTIRQICDKVVDMDISGIDFRIEPGSAALAKYN